MLGRLRQLAGDLRQRGARLLAPELATSVVPAKPVRRDGWTNAWTGMGTSRDKVAATYFAWGARLEWQELEGLYYFDDIAARIVDTKPEHMLRRGYEIEEYSGAEDLCARMRELAVDDKLLEAMRWARLYGGAAILLGAEDGLDPQYPLAVERVRQVRFLTVVDRRFLFPVAYYSDPMSPKYGEPEVFEITNPLGGDSSYVHESRLVQFLGTSVDALTRRREGGWSYSVLQRPYDTLQKFATGFGAAGQLIADAGQGVFKLAGLLEKIANGEEGVTISRMAAVDMARSAGRSLLLDAEEEEFERAPVQISGVPELLDRLMLRVSAAAEMPVTMLFGREPAGLNATGESDLVQWRDSVATAQSKTLLPALTRIVQVLTAGKFDGEIEFCPLEDPDEKSEADVEKTRAETDKLYVDMGALHPEQVAMHRFADEPIEIDVAAYKRIVAEEVAMAEAPPEPPPALEPPPAPGQVGPPAAPAAPEPPPPPPEKPVEDAADLLARRHAALLGDLKDLRELGMRVDQGVVDELAAKYGVPSPKLEKK